MKTVQMNGYITNSQRGQLSVGLIAQSVEHCTAGYRRGHGFTSRSDLIFFSGFHVRITAMISHIFKRKHRSKLYPSTSIKSEFQLKALRSEKQTRQTWHNWETIFYTTTENAAIQNTGKSLSSILSCYILWNITLVT